MNFTHEELVLMMLYNPGTRSGLIEMLQEMREQLQPDEAELRGLTDSTLEKLAAILDADFDRLDLYEAL
jgi:hypothetical protein